MTLGSLIKNFKWRLSKIFLSDEKRLWNNVTNLNKRFKKGEIIPLNEYSTIATIKQSPSKRAVCIFDGKTRNGGLADRLRGIVSVYQICKEQNLEFKIVFTSPFNLSDFLEPNIIDWRITGQELNYNTTITDLCYIETLNGSDYEAKKQKEWFRKEFKKKHEEFHVRTNALFSYEGDYPTLFNELFKPSPKLHNSIEKQKKILGAGYISTSFRFMNLLNDFNETFELHSKITKEEQSELIAKNIEQLQLLHNKYPDKRILVNSDSTTFLKTAAEFDYVYVIPGTITHIDGKNSGDEYERYEKTFLDFFMIANAERIFLLRTGQMYDSGYPFAASKIYNKPFEKIEY